MNLWEILSGNTGKKPVKMRKKMVMVMKKTLKKLLIYSIISIREAVVKGKGL